MSSAIEPTRMRAARDQYFRDNGFGPNGGYDEAWVEFKLGTIPFPFPNSPARKRAVPYHDLHHLVTGYSTDFLGEVQISAWEIGAGCKRVWFAWMINLGGLFAGMLIAPKLTARAFARGLATDTLYGESYEQLLDESVVSVAYRLGVAQPGTEPSLRSNAWLALATLGGLLAGLFQVALILPLVPVGLLAGRLRRRPETAADREVPRV